MDVFDVTNGNAPRVRCQECRHWTGARLTYRVMGGKVYAVRSCHRCKYVAIVLTHIRPESVGLGYGQAA